MGAVYTRENLEALAAMLEEKGKEIGHPIYLISDEPYREITYGVEVPYVPTIYPRTLVCYSYSKALSLPGERVGYVYVSDTMDAEEADRVVLRRRRRRPCAWLHLRAGAVPARCRCVRRRAVRC